MSNVKKGLAAIKAAQEERAAAQASRDRVKADWLSLRDGESVTVRFTQELDEEAANYDSRHGMGFIAVEHNGPGSEGYKFRALCTADSGQCWMCEQHRADPKAGWRPKQNLYVNLLVERDGEKKVYIISKNANSSFAKSLIEWASDNDSITDTVFKIKRTGQKTETVYMLMPFPKGKLDDFDLTKVDSWDLDDQMREIPYENQPTYFAALVGSQPTSSDEGNPWDGKEAKPVSTSDSEW